MKRKIIISLSLISVTFLIIYSLHLFRWIYTHQKASDVFTDTFNLTSLHANLIDLEAEPWERMHESWFSPWFYGFDDMGISHSEKLNLIEVEHLVDLLKDIRIRPYSFSSFFSFPQLPLEPEFPISFTYVFLPSEDDPNEIGDDRSFQIEFIGSEVLTLRNDVEGIDQAFSVHPEDQYVLQEILIFLESEIWY